MTVSHQTENINKKIFLIIKSEIFTLKKYGTWKVWSSEVKNSLEGLNNRYNLGEERICELQGKSIKIMESEEWGETRKKEWEK